VPDDDVVRRAVELSSRMKKPPGIFGGSSVYVALSDCFIFR
jgi:hypothetical protein